MIELGLITLLLVEVSFTYIKYDLYLRVIVKIILI